MRTSSSHPRTAYSARRLGLVLALTAASGLAAPGTAGAWKFTFTDRFYVAASGPGGVAQSVTARKCSGGMLGIYKVVGRTVTTAGDTVYKRYDLPVTSTWKRITGVVVQASGPNLSRPMPPPFSTTVAAEVDRSLTRFFSTMFARWSPGKVTLRHQGLVIFGRQVAAPAERAIPFRPKAGC